MNNQPLTHWSRSSIIEPNEFFFLDRINEVFVGHYKDTYTHLYTNDAAIAQSNCTQLCIQPESYKNSLPLLLSLFFIQPSLEFVSIAYNLYLQEINSHTNAQ